MSIDDLNTFLAQYLRTQFDPSAPLPDLWPSGGLGVFLVFVLPTVVGIPLGVIMARDAALSPLLTAGLYFARALALAVTAAPILFRRSRRRSSRTIVKPTSTPHISPGPALPLASAPSAARLPRKRATHTGRRRPSRGVHR